MNAKFRNVGRVNFKSNARERDPVKLIQKKIAVLAWADKSNPEVTKKHEREVRTAIKGIKKSAFKRYGQVSARLFAKAGQLTASLELALGGRPMRDHANRRTLVSIRKKGVTPCSK
jgi:TPP-dependent pyruvate/acetoin dehydrogenase alpha subunit